MRAVFIFDAQEVGPLLHLLRTDYIIEVDDGSVEVVEHPRSYTPAALAYAAFLRESQVIYRASPRPPSRHRGRAPAQLFYPYRRRATPPDIIIIEDEPESPPGEASPAQEEQEARDINGQQMPENNNAALEDIPLLAEEASLESSGYESENNSLEDFLRDLQ